MRAPCTITPCKYKHLFSCLNWIFVNRAPSEKFLPRDEQDPKLGFYSISYANFREERIRTRWVCHSIFFRWDVDVHKKKKEGLLNARSNGLANICRTGMLRRKISLVRSPARLSLDEPKIRIRVGRRRNPCPYLLLCSPFPLRCSLFTSLCYSSILEDVL